jgi:hypothetical protein
MDVKVSVFRERGHERGCYDWCVLEPATASRTPARPLVRAAARLAARAALLCVSASFVSASCGQTLLGIMPGVINDPGNVGLRRAILKFGIDRVCAEMTKRSLPLRLNPDDPSVGRFVTHQCASQDLGNGELAVQFRGSGYVWTNLTQRMAFDAGGAIQYDTDFQMDGSTMYIYFRKRASSGVTFQTKLVEQPQAAAVNALPFGQGGQGIGNALGTRIMEAEIAKGFTVIRESNGSADFGVGMVPKGERPQAPYRVTDGGKVMLANDRSEVHQNQRDFVGPLEVTEGAELIVHATIDGAPAIDVLILPRGPGEMWLAQYTTQAATTPPPSAPLLDEPIRAGGVWKKTLSLPAGLYYVVLDNTATAGRSMPTTHARDDRAAMVSYGIALDP